MVNNISLLVLPSLFDPKSLSLYNTLYYIPFHSYFIFTASYKSLYLSLSFSPTEPKPNSTAKAIIMEVMIPTAQDFDFGSSTLTSPYSSMPPTPSRFGSVDYFFSAPTSPSRISNFYGGLSSADSYRPFSPPAVPYHWESNPGTPKTEKKQDRHDDDNDFAFEFSEDLERASLSADELFDGGKIRPLKPPPRLQTVERGSPKRPASPGESRERGREISVNYSSSASGRRAARSLSPLRVSKYQWEDVEEKEHKNNNQHNKQQQAVTTTPTTNKQQILALFSKPSFWSSPTSSSSSKKWRLRDFLLFRSASEGRATDKDPFKKYTNMYKGKADQQSGSFGSGERRGRRRGPAVSAHALHYAANKAVSEDMKKKTFLPYKQGILGRLAFNPAVHALANGFGSLTRA